MPLATVIRAPVISEESASRVREMVDWIAECGDSVEMHNTIIPAIREIGFVRAFHQQLLLEVERKLKALGAPVSRGDLRALMFPPALPRVGPDELPEWAKPYCWVTSQDAFYNTVNGEFLSLRSFDVAHGRKMPIGESGRRLSAAEKCTQFWDMPIVAQVGYRPDCGAFYEWDGVRYANSYSPTSLPPVAVTYTQAGSDGIQAFTALLWDMCGRREAIYLNLLYWYAHNVQHPGKKIRWAPIVKGINGDGKTLCITVLRAAMGFRNLSTTSNSNIANSGGFTDWAVRGAVNVIEEIMLTGKQRHQLYNAMKEFISNNVVDVNVKGGKPRQQWNCTNHYANTNHNDALPLEQTDRRWFVVFTPWADRDGMLAFCGLDRNAWEARIAAIDHAKDHCASELRAWFLSLPIPPTFDINGAAMVTPEKQRMMASSKDDVESVIEAIIAEGSEGITERVISTSHLSRMLALRSSGGGFDVPKTTTLTHMLSRLGYSKMDKQVKWRGLPLRVWVKNGGELTPEDVRSQLDSSLLKL